MKRIYDLSPKEVLEIKDDQVRDYVNRELFEKNIPISVLTLSVDETIDPEAPKPEGYFFKIGDLNIGVYDPKDAMVICRALAEAKAFCVDTMYYDGNYQSVYGKTKCITNLTPKQMALYTKEELDRISKINKKATGGDGVKNKRSMALQIESDVYSYIKKVEQEYQYNEKLCTVFDEYLKIADDNKEMALKFLEQAYRFNEYTEEFIRSKKGMEIEVKE